MGADNQHECSGSLSLGGHITAPLVGDYSVVHHAMDDPQHLSVKEECFEQSRVAQRAWGENGDGRHVRSSPWVLRYARRTGQNASRQSIDQWLCQNVL